MNHNCDRSQTLLFGDNYWIDGELQNRSVYRCNCGQAWLYREWIGSVAIDEDRVEHERGLYKQWHSPATPVF